MSDSRSPRELSVPEFVEVLVRRIAALPGCERVAFDPAGPLIRFEHQGQAQRIRPQQAYAAYRQDPARLEALLETLTATIRRKLAEAAPQPPAPQPSPPPPREPARPNRHRIPSHPPDWDQAQLLSALRERYLALQKRPPAGGFERMLAPDPPWMKPSDGLSEIGRAQRRLLAEGRIHWGALVQANSLLFEPGPQDCPALLVYGTDPHFDARPQELFAIAQKIFELKGSTPDDPELRETARLVTDEMDRTMGWQVPPTLTAKQVRTAAFMVFRRHIPGGVLTAIHFPILVHPATPAVMVVPCETWPAELVRTW